MASETKADFDKLFDEPDSIDLTQEMDTHTDFIGNERPQDEQQPASRKRKGKPKTKKRAKKPKVSGRKNPVGALLEGKDPFMGSPEEGESKAEGKGKPKKDNRYFSINLVKIIAGYAGHMVPLSYRMHWIQYEIQMSQKRKTKLHEFFADLNLSS